MRIKSIQLSWFRGAADPVALVPNCKSMVVYGSNGSGKSCFVDAIEFVLEDGRIEHLAHEYSGRKQEKAIVNTHRPTNQQSGLNIKFKDDSELEIKIAEDGSHTSSGAKAVAMHTWEYRRTVLRQREVAEFIRSTKGDKYSALLPLLGLHSMELAAENLRKIAKSVGEQSQRSVTKQKLMEVVLKRKATFDADTDDQILAKIKDLHVTYCPGKAATTDAMTRCKELKQAINTRIEKSSADQRRYVALRDAALVDLKGHVDAVRAASGKLAGVVEPLITEKLEVLISTALFAKKLKGETEVICPACGRAIPVQDFQGHVAAEQESLRDIIATFEARKTAIGTLCTTVQSLQSTFSKSDLNSWRNELSKGTVADDFTYLDELDAEALRVCCEEQDLKSLQKKLQPLIDAANSSSKDAPPDAQQLSVDKQTADVARDVMEAKALAVAMERDDALIDFINSLEQGTRDEIRSQAENTINNISADIQAMWTILHPGEEIENVHLYLPDDSDKAIDIGLKFYGVDQDSPRLTLSEGHRNSLGLCIFLAMAKQGVQNDRPIILDDVIVSFDRGHRGMIAEILEKEFSQRQMIVLTHDRDWYTDLRAQLDSKSWEFKRLLPYKTPKIGIRWSHKTSNFGDARALSADHPAAAGSDARKIMDVELAAIAERLQLRLRFLRGDKNDKRMANEFLERLVSDGEICFQIQQGENHTVYVAGLDMIKEASKLLVSWANRASHTFDIVPSEAIKLIDTCEAALGCFKCTSCGKFIWSANVANQKRVQCECGKLRWRYGKRK